MKKILLVAGILALSGAVYIQLRPQPEVTVSTAESTKETITNNEKVPSPPAGNGPSNHSLYLATSDDHESWNLDEEPLVKAASVPDLITLTQDLGDWPAGTLVSYFVDASDFNTPGDEKLGIIYSLDSGATWSEALTGAVLGGDVHTPVDPSVVQLDDGRLRLFYFDFPTTPSQMDSPSTFYSAISTDGITFTLEGVALEDIGMTDPDVIQFNELWYMFYAKPDSERLVYYATSDDGLTFTAQSSIPVTGIPGSLVVDDELRVYGCGQGDIVYIALSDGEKWSEETSVFKGPDRMIICDPAPTQTEDGQFVIMTKQAEPNQKPPSEEQLNEPKPRPKQEPISPAV